MSDENNNGESEGSDESSINLIHQEESSKIELKTTSERCDIHTQNRNQIEQTSHVEPNLTSSTQRLNSELKVLYSQFTLDSNNSNQSVECENLIARPPPDNDDVTCMLLQTSNVNPKIEKSDVRIPPSYSETKFNECREPEEFQLNITPASCPPVVLYSAPPLQGAPPTYSALMRIGTDLQPRRSLRLFGRREIRMQPSPPFIAPVPPPSYAEVQGLVTGRSIIPQSIIDIHDSAFGFLPVSVLCPICNNFVVTNTNTRRSNVTHFSALALCICGCWPCCLLPYCIKSCKTTYHECPLCLNLIGIYNPW